MVTINDINKRVLPYESAAFMLEVFNDTVEKYGCITVYDLVSFLLDADLIQRIDYRYTKYGWTEPLFFKKHFVKKETRKGFIVCELNLPNFKGLEKI